MIILLVIIGLALLILGHEAGHFFFAKLFKVQVDEFGFGFPPRMFGVKKPKGGKWKFFWGKEPVDSGSEAGMTEERGAPQRGPFGEGGTIYSINWLPFGGFVRIPGENDLFDPPEGGQAGGVVVDRTKLLTSQPVWKRSLIVLAGVIANFFIGWLVISVVFMVGVPPKVVVMDVEKGGPAETAGFKANDIVQNYDKSQDLINFINANKGKEISINILRDGNEQALKVTPRTIVPAGKGAVGIALSDSGIPKESFFSAIGSGLTQAWSILKDTAVAFFGVLKSVFINRTVPADVMGPVGIVSFAATAGRLGIVYFLQLLAIISLNLAIMNLVPFPALDGGRFLFLLIEKIKGSPIPRSLEAWVNGIGFVLLILLMVVVTVRDIARL